MTSRERILIALDHRMDTFRSLGVEVVALSVDSQFTHNAWRNTPVNSGGIGPVSYTMAADVRHDICRAYDVESAGPGGFFRPSHGFPPANAPGRRSSDSV